MLRVTTTGAQTVDEIIQKYVNAVGGAENWKKIHSLRTTGYFKLNGVDYSFNATALNRKGIRTEINFGGKSVCKVMTPVAGWTFDQLEIPAKVEEMSKEEVLQSQDGLDIEGDLIDYKAKGHSIVYKGIDTVDGVACYKLCETLSSGKEENMYIDAHTYLLVRSAQKITYNGPERIQTITYRDYKKLEDGIYFPKILIIDYGTITISDFEVNIPIDEEIFKPMALLKGGSNQK